MNASKQKPMLIAKIPLRVLLLALSILLIVLMGIAIGVGSVPISQSTVWGIIGNKLSFTNSLPTWSMGRENIVWAVRLPRVILAAIVGATLAVVGAALQSVTRNPLADPHLLGISSGAALGAIIALLHTGMILGVVTVPVFAFLGALFAMFLVLGVANFSMAHSAGRLILAGVAVAFVLTALGNLFIFMGDHRASHTVIFWMLGGLGLAQWGQLWFPFLTLLLGASYLIYKARYLNAMMSSYRNCGVCLINWSRGGIFGRDWFCRFDGAAHCAFIGWRRLPKNPAFVGVIWRVIFGVRRHHRQSHYSTRGHAYRYFNWLGWRHRLCFLNETKT